VQHHFHIRLGLINVTFIIQQSQSVTSTPLWKKYWNLLCEIRLQTRTKQSWKKSRRVAGAVTKVCWNFFATAERTNDSTFGHVFL